MREVMDRGRRHVADLVVEVHDDMDRVSDLWKEFQRRAGGGPHDSWEWNNAWRRTAGSLVVPKIVIGRSDGRPVFLLPLAVRTRLGCKVLEWFSADQGNYASGLFDRLSWKDGNLPRGEALLEHILKVFPEVDAVHLAAQPDGFIDSPNPLAGLPGVAGASSGYAFKIGPDLKEQFADRVSQRYWKTYYRRERRLAEVGPVRLKCVEDRDERVDVLHLIFDHKQQWLAERGITDLFAEETIRNFFHSLIQEPDTGTGFKVAVYQLTAGDEVIAASLDIHFQDCFYGLISTTTPGPLRKYGPGNILFHRLVDRLRQEGIKHFDFGVGENQQKTRWGIVQRNLSHGLFAVTAKGQVYLKALEGALTAKRLIKQSPQAWSVAQWLRQWKWLSKPAVALGAASTLASLLLIES